MITANDIPTNANPLDCDYTSVDVRRAVLAGNLPYELQVRICEVQQYKPGSSHAGDSFIYVELTNIMPGQTPTGDVVNPGQVVIFDRINLRPYGKMTQKMVNESIARFQQAFTKTPQKLSETVAQAAGRTVKANVRLDPAGTSTTGKSFPEKNSIGYYLPAS